jgi:hypothetical protein
MKQLALVGMTLSLGLFSQGAVAGKLIDHSAGLKLLLGADVWSTPSNVPPALQNGPMFVGNAAGLSYGAMPYYEIRIIKLLGAEAGLNYEIGSFHRNVTYNGGMAEVKETVDVKALRFPLLAKLNIPFVLGRLWLGAGPEFTLTQSSSGKLEVTKGALAGTANVRTRDVKPTYLTGGLGMVIEIPLVGIEVPIELRISKNMSQPDNWAERVAFNMPTATDLTYTVRAESSWAYRLGAGLGFQF